VDRCTIIRELHRIWDKHKDSKADTTTLELLNSINHRLNQSIRKKEQRQSHIPKITYPQSLPILQKKDEIIESIKRHRVTVITGETGSGKTTQIPKMCIEAGRGIDGIIGCTQPRRIAAITVSQRIADELNQELGMAVGYKIRFDDTSSRRNYIKMTNGSFIAESAISGFVGVEFEDKSIAVRALGTDALGSELHVDLKHYSLDEVDYRERVDEFGTVEAQLKSICSRFMHNMQLMAQSSSTATRLLK